MELLEVFVMIYYLALVDSDVLPQVSLCQRGVQFLIGLGFGLNLFTFDLAQVGVYCCLY